MLSRTKARALVGGRQVNSHGAAQRTAHQHDLVFVDPRPAGKPGPRRPRVGQHAGLAGLSLTAAETAIVENQGTDAEAIVKDSALVGPLSNVSGVAVTENRHGPRLLVCNVPAVQSRAVGGGEPGILEIQPRGMPVALRVSGGDEDQRSLDAGKRIQACRGGRRCRRGGRLVLRRRTARWRRRRLRYRQHTAATGRQYDGCRRKKRQT